MGKAQQKTCTTITQESQIAPLIGMNLLKNQNNFQEFYLKPIAIAYNEVCKAFLQDQYNICFLMIDYFSLSFSMEGSLCHTCSSSAAGTPIIALAALLEVLELRVRCQSRSAKLIHAQNCAQFSCSLTLFIGTWCKKRTWLGRLHSDQGLYHWYLSMLQLS